jgi:hypothetical protein
MLMAIFISNYATLRIGSDYYKNLNKCEIFDIFHKILPDLNEYHYTVDLIAFIGLVSLFIISNTSLTIEFIAKFTIIMFIRAFTIISTILPKHEVCTDKFDLRSYFLGGCYDKIFSGHTSFTLLLTLIYYREHIVNEFSLIGINAINILLILATRSHYTVDILLAIFVTTTIFNINV